MPTVIRQLRTRNRSQRTSVDQLPHMLASHLIFGHQLMLPVPDIDRTRYLLSLGANPLASNGSMMTAPGVARRLKALRDARRPAGRDRPAPHRDRGASPTRTTSSGPAPTRVPARADPHACSPRASRGPARLADGLDGLARSRGSRAPSPPERVAGDTGDRRGRASARIAREFAARRRPPATDASASRTQQFGGAGQWLINVLNVVTGNLDRPGGTMFTAAGGGPVRCRAPRRAATSAAGRAGCAGCPSSAASCPVACWPRRSRRRATGQIRALVTIAGNPVLSTPNGRSSTRRSARSTSWSRRPVPQRDHPARARDPAADAAARAGPLRPGVPPLAVRNTARWNDAVLRRPPEARHDWEIFLDLGARACYAVRRRSRRKVDRVGAVAAVAEAGRRPGPADRAVPAVRCGKLRKSPHGIDLGPLQPRTARRPAQQAEADRPRASG